ncbi:MAG: hypothetical protein KGI38_11175 [Thaumarchaeota archaeon]|nr:hypothetical protein [Nitrososphaerota archaeon]
MQKIPSWVDAESTAQIHSSVVFVPFEGNRTIIGKRAKIDSGAVIYGGVELGPDCIVGHNSILRQNSRIGAHSVIGNLTMLEGNLSVGEHSLIHSNNHLGQNSEIGDYVFMAPLCVMTNDPKMIYYRKGYSKVTGAHWKTLKGARIEFGARIAVGVIFFPRIKIGRQSVIGAGTVVTRDVPDYSVVFGVPGKVKGQVDPREDRIAKCEVDHS